MRFWKVGILFYSGRLDLHIPRPVLMGMVYLLILAAPWAAWRAVDWTQNHAYTRLAGQAQDRLALYGGTLHSEIEKFRNVPRVLASDPDVRVLLDRHDAVLAQALSRRLQLLNSSLDASAIYVMDHDGLTLSASNWAEGVGSFVGQRFDFRPYYADAIEGRQGRYFALGSTSNLPGYYMATPVRRGEEVLGAVVVKMPMDEVERGWSGGGERVFVSDSHGIIFITNSPAWRYKSLHPLDTVERQLVRSSRQYGDAPLPLLGMVVGEKLVTVDGRGYVAASQPLADGDGWTLTVLVDAATAQTEARNSGLLAVLSMSLAGLAIYYMAHRSRLRRRQTRELERRVVERTAALTESNERLQGEIVERHRAEAELKEKQDELVQAAKLAALGQMSAGMAHEINQPLAALRSYADNAVVFLNMGRTDGARDNLTEIADLTERMARITGQLKQFARKSSGGLEPVDAAAMIESALALLSGRLRAEDVTLVWTPPAEPVKVWGDEVRLQQVLVNLLRNGLDAIKDRPQRQLEIGLLCLADGVDLSVRDSGAGIAPDAMAQLFDPFFTTKPAGEGLGLGLSISEGIVRDLGGHLSAANHPGGGALFTITLRRVEES